MHHEPTPPAPAPRACSTPHSAPIAWLRNEASVPTASASANHDALRGAIELVLANPEAVAEIIHRGSPRGVRHDGWTGERMAAFLETLADTGLITEACRIVGMSRDAAYSLRNRDPVFAGAMRAALAKARPQVADAILERSITGTVEHYYRDGVLVGERRHYQSWLALAVLKRLDKQAEEDCAEGALSARIAGDWQATLDGLRSGGTAALPELLAPKADKADTSPSPPGYDPSDNVWQSEDGKWMTTFLPPPGFAGHESGAWDGFNYYERECTEDEAELLDAHAAAAQAAELAELTADAEAERDRWFGGLRASLASACAITDWPAPANSPSTATPAPRAASAP